MERGGSGHPSLFSRTVGNGCRDKGVATGLRSVPDDGDTAKEAVWGAI